MQPLRILSSCRECLVGKRSASMQRNIFAPQDMTGSMTRNSVTRTKSGLGAGWSFISGVIALSLLLLDSSVGWTQQTASALYFASEEIRLARLIERKEIFNYEVVLMGERRYRETYFDTADLLLYHQRMFYRVKETFDGQARIEFYGGGATKHGASLGFIHSVALPARTVLAVREGRLDDPVLYKGLPLPGGHDFKNIQLTAEYARHSVALERLGKQEFFVSLLAGSFVGFSGKKVQVGFLALEVQAAASRPTEAQLRETERITKYLIGELKLRSDAKSLYTQGIEKAVLLRSDERRMQPVRIIGGAKGNGIDQFDAPDAVAFTLDGRLIAGDTDNARFKIYGLEDQYQTVQIVGREGSGAGEFGHSLAAKLGSFKIYNQVQGIAVDNSGLIYVIDQGNQRVQVFDAGGKVLPEKAIPLRHCAKESPRCSEGLWRPTKKNEYTSVQGLAVDADGGIFLSDRGTSRVYRLLPGGKLDPGFNLQELDSATGKPTLNDPESMVVYQHRLYVANESTGEIKIFDRKTGKLTGSVAGFGGDVFGGKVEGLAVVRDYLFAVDVQNTRIAVFDLRSEKPKFLLGFVGDFQSADGIAIDPTGKYVAIADQGNLRIVLYSLPEILEHLAGGKP
jgi:DNA-binding beta-propeller fold protein YncE